MLIKAVLMFVMALAAIGLGWPLLRILTPARFAATRWPAGVAGFMGLFVAASVAIIVNFVAPVVPAVSFAVLAAGLLSFAFVARRIGPWSWVALAGLCLALTPVMLSHHEGYDGGLYHLPSQLWMVSEKIVFGLANLHGRFGFNSMNEALLSLGWINGGDLAAVQVLAGLFSVFFLLAVFEAVRDAADDAVRLYLGTMIGLCYIWMHGTVGMPMGWTSTDIPTAIAVLFSLYYGFAAAENDDRDDLVLSFFFAAFAIGLKPSGGIVALFPLAVAGLRVARAGWATVPLGQILVIVLVFVPWTARNVIVSGCLAYPLTTSCLPLPWQASDVGYVDAIWAIAWGRAPATGLDHLTGWAWLPIWFSANFKFLLSWGAMALLGVIVAVSIGRRDPSRRPPVTAAVLLSVYALVATAFWFLTAPAPRFGIGQLLAVALLPGLWILVLARPGPANERPMLWVPTSLLIASVIVTVGYSWRRGLDDDRSLFTYRPLVFAEVPTRVEGPVRRPIDDDRCYLTAPPCSLYGTLNESTLGSYRIYYGIK